MEATKAAIHSKAHLKSQYSCLQRHRKTSIQLISVGGGNGSKLTSKKLEGKLWIGELHGVVNKRGHLGIVKSSSRYDSLKADINPNTNTNIALPTSSTELESGDEATSFQRVSGVPLAEEVIEKAIFNCRFFTLMAVAGSLAGSALCFLKGCTFVFDSFKEYFRSFHGSGKVILLLVEAIDIYLMGTVMLILGMGLYELFVSSLEVPDQDSTPHASRANMWGSNLFGLFALQERPKWLEIQSLDELKTKLGHVIVMVLLVGMFEKSKRVPITSGLDLLFFSGSVFLSSGCLFLLSKLHTSK
ncbi:hypothetical protein SUGI_0176850 [Cryptomeria japonica]|nr:hypothetical protein SUGI_0176850 [Cryptomeria japonica]